MVLYRLTTDIVYGTGTSVGIELSHYLYCPYYLVISIKFPIMIYFIGFIWFFSVNNCLIIEFYTTLQIVILSKVARDLFMRYKLTAIYCRATNYPLSIDLTLSIGTADFVNAYII